MACQNQGRRWGLESCQVQSNTKYETGHLKNKNAGHTGVYLKTEAAVTV
jgi:hypothetical protein